MKITLQSYVHIDSTRHEVGEVVDVADDLAQSLIDNGFAKTCEDQGVAAVAAAPLSQNDPAGNEAQLPVQPVQNEVQPPVVPNGFPQPTHQPSPEQIAADMAALEAQSQPQAINVQIN